MTNNNATFANYYTETKLELVFTKTVLVTSGL